MLYMNDSTKTTLKTVPYFYLANYYHRCPSNVFPIYRTPFEGCRPKLRKVSPHVIVCLRAYKENYRNLQSIRVTEVNIVW